MAIFSFLWILICIAGLGLACKSVSVLGKRSRATTIGWLLTAAYFALAAIDAVRAASAPLHIDYIALAGLTGAFIVAGVRDEPQAEPWWWPAKSGLTGAERRTKHL